MVSRPWKAWVKVFPRFQIRPHHLHLQNPPSSSDHLGCQKNFPTYLFPADLLRRTFSDEPSPTDLLPQTFSHGPSPTDLLQRTLFVEPSPANLLQRTFSGESSPLDLFSNSLLAGPLSVTLTCRAVNSNDTSYGRVSLRSHQLALWSIPMTFPTTPNLPIELSTCLTSLMH